MGDVGNAGLGVLDLDLLVEFGRHALEVSNHHLDLRNLTALLVHLELFEPDEALAARFQDLYSLHIKSVPKRPIRRRAAPSVPRIGLGDQSGEHGIALGDRRRLIPLLAQKRLQLGEDGDGAVHVRI
ncbi:hypothetical protein D3C87_1349380 [compost metagenome]